MLDRIAEKGSFEVVEDFAYPLPVAVICRLLGVPLEDEPQFSQASALLAQSLDPFVDVHRRAVGVGQQDRMQAGRWLREYFHGLIDRRRSRPGDDLLSGLIAVEESGDQLTEEEIVSTCILLLVAGHETTVNLIGNAILAMLRHPRAVGRARSPTPVAPRRSSRRPCVTTRPCNWLAELPPHDMTIGASRCPRAT